jgi:hypothetical protein
LKSSEAATAIDPPDLRRAFGSFGTGVTANSLNTVSLQPASVAAS